MDSVPNPPAPNPPAIEHLARVPKVWQCWPCYFLDPVWRRAGIRRLAGSAADRTDAGGDPGRHQRRHGACATPFVRRRSGDRWLPCRRFDLRRHLSAPLQGMAAVPRRRGGHRCGVQSARLADQPLAYPARHHRGLGLSPGAATAMVLMAGAFGADQRLVAFMQYLRVIFVSMTAALIARVDTSGIEIPAIIWFPPIDPLAFAATLGVALVGSLIGKLFRLPSPFFLGTFIFGTAVHLGLGVTMQLPPWLLALGYTMIGWTIGLNFTRAILRHATRALPQIVGSIIILIAFCGGLGFMISHVLGIDPLTAYLALAPAAWTASPSSPPPHSMSTSPSSWRCNRPASSSVKIAFLRS